MKITIHRFWNILCLIIFINIVIHVIFSHYQRSDKRKNKKPLKYKYGRRVVFNIPKNMKTLYDLIVCNKTDTREVDEIDLKNEAKGNFYINISDFRFQYYFNRGVEKLIAKPCPVIAPDLGPVTEGRYIQSLFDIQDLHLRIQAGGIHAPIECMAIQKVAIVIPIHETCPRIRQYIDSFLYYIHPFLIKQQLEYQIFVIIKPNATTPYKRGELYNIGFKEVQGYSAQSWDCIIFHDAHLIPLDTRNLYRCSHRPRRLIADFHKPYKKLLLKGWKVLRNIIKNRFGGAIAMSPNHFIKVNGFSNLVWSNDGDYIDMCKRLVAANFTLEGNVASVGNYSFFEYLRQENLEPEKTQTVPPEYLNDGLSNVVYNIKQRMKLKKFYTLIEIDVE